MNGTANHLTGLLQRLLDHFQNRGQRRLRRMYDRKTEWIRQAREAPTLAETMYWRAPDDLARRRYRRHRGMDEPDSGWSGGHVYAS
jgi:hypothetical protein